MLMQLDVAALSNCYESFRVLALSFCTYFMDQFK